MFHTNVLLQIAINIPQPKLFFIFFHKPSIKSENSNT